MTKKKKTLYSIFLPIILIIVSVFTWVAVYNSKGRTANRITNKLYREKLMSSYVTPSSKGYSNFDADDAAAMDSISTHLDDKADREIFSSGLVYDNNSSYKLVVSKRIFGIIPQYKLEFTPIVLTIITDVPKFTYRIGSNTTFEKPDKISEVDYYGSTAYKSQVVIYPTENDMKTKVTVQDKHYSQDKKVTLDKNRSIYLSIYGNVD